MPIVDLARCSLPTSETNARGSLVWRHHVVDGSRYDFDFEMCTTQRGWAQWDTEQDAWYFGVWVHREARRVVTYAEGDVTIVASPDDERFAAELASMVSFYGPPPPAFIVLDLEAGTRTEIFDERLVAADLGVSA